MQVLYGFNSLSAPSWTAAASGLQELYVDGFDTEQIWGQLEASSGPLLKQLRKKWKGLGQDFQLLDENTEKALDGELAEFLTCSSLTIHLVPCIKIT